MRGRRTVTVRKDIDIDWALSPRIITVLSPSADISIQDLHDTLSTLEARQDAMDNPRIFSTGGKEFLDATTSVGLTMTLLNALIAFEARPGPAFEQVRIDGGNLVALDALDVPVDPVATTAFTQVVRTSSSSATLQNQEALQAATFSGFVAIDILNGAAGTEFPRGTREFPCDNLVDAHIIAEERGLQDFQIISSMTFTSEDFSNGHKFVGDSIATVTVILDPSTNIANCTFQNMTIEGTLDGDNVLRDCRLRSVTNVSSGGVHSSLIEGTINILGNVKSQWFDCWSSDSGLDIGDYPIFDMGGSGNNLVVRGWSGGLGIQNVTSGTDESVIDFESGRAVFDATVAAGRFGVRGVADVTDNSTGTAVIEDNTLNGKVQELVKAQFNKMITDPDTGTITIFEDDDTTIFKTGSLFEDDNATQPYRGQGAERRERMT